jgi:WD40 repeat protein
VWDIRTAMAVAQAKTGALIHAVSFSEDGTYFVTAGHKHLKYWYLDSTTSPPAPDKAAAAAVAASGSSSSPGPVAFVVGSSQGQRWSVLEGKSVALGGHRESTFIDVSCGRGASRGCVHAVTFGGTLYGFNSGRQMEKWVDLRGHVYALTSSEKYVGCACADGNIRLFDPMTLNYMLTLPKPHPLGRDLIAEQQIRASPTNVYPDAIACRLLMGDSKVACFYSDRSMYIWSIESGSKIIRTRSCLSHAASIWDVVVAPKDQQQS